MKRCVTSLLLFRINVALFPGTSFGFYIEHDLLTKDFSMQQLPCITILQQKQKTKYKHK